MATITQLSERIATNTAVVEAWLAKTKATPPSFAENADEEFPSTIGEPTIEAARAAILEDTSTLHDLVSGPGEVVRELCWTIIDNAAQQCIYHFDFLQKIPLGTRISYKDLASSVNLTLAQTKAIVRQSAMNRILREDGPDHVAHTAASAMLVRNKVMRDWYGLCVEDVFPAGAKLAEALEKFSASSSSKDYAFGLAFNTKLPLYEYYAQHPAQQARFFGAMAGVGKDHGHSLEHIVTGYPWATLNDGVVVDIGGSAGHLSIELAKGHDNLSKLVVQDYKDTVEGGAANLPAELQGRVDFMPHDFFNPQPVKEADVYIMRHICHNWSAEDSAKIIKQIIPAMKATSKILLIDVVVTPVGAEESKIAERYTRHVDLTMLAMHNNLERSVEDWKHLVSLTDSRLEMACVHKPKGSWDSIIELSLQPGSA